MKRILKLTVLSVAFALGLTAGAMGLMAAALVADAPAESIEPIAVQRG